MPSKPTPGAAPGWATNLNAFLDAAHDTDGTIRAHTEVFLADFGVQPNTSNDHTTEFQAALDQAAAATVPGNGTAVKLILPWGRFFVHELQWAGTHTIEGQGPGATTLSYGGAGGAGTYLIRMPDGTGGIGYAGMKRFGLEGWTRSTGDPIAWNLIATGTNGLDWGLMFESIVGYFSLSDAMDFSTSRGVTNLHFHHCRWGSVMTGHCIRLNATVGTERRPVSIDKFTWDNNVISAFMTTVQSLYPAQYLDASTQSHGFVRIEGNSGGIEVDIQDGRLELNARLMPNAEGIRSVLYEDSTDLPNIWKVRDMCGYTRMDDNAALLHTHTYKAIIDIDRGLDQTRPLVMTGSGATAQYMGEVPYTSSANGPWRYSGNAQQHNGETIQGKQFEVRHTAPGASIFSFYRQGDVFWRAKPTPGTQGMGHIVTSPTGISQFAAATELTNAVVTAGSAVVDISASVNDQYKLQVDAELTIAGAGASGANLDVKVTATDPAAHTITVTPTPSTSVNPATITWRAPVLKEFGDIVTYGTAAPASGTFNRGEKRWNTTPSVLGTAGAQYVLLGWICTVAGTPGTWVEMLTLTGT